MEIFGNLISERKLDNRKINYILKINNLILKLKKKWGENVCIKKCIDYWG